MAYKPSNNKLPNRKKQADAWATESSFDSSISLEELLSLPVFKQASDGTGESYTAASRIPNWLRRRMQKLVETPGSPYTLLSDVVRDALYLGMHILLMRHNQTSDLATQTKMASVIDKAIANKNQLKRLTDFASSIVDIIDDGDEQKAIQFIEDFVSNLSELTDDWYKDRAIGIIWNNEKINTLIKENLPQIETFISGYYADKEDPDNQDAEE